LLGDYLGANDPNVVSSGLRVYVNGIEFDTLAGHKKLVVLVGGVDKLSTHKKIRKVVVVW
jgi:hypothetical protein